MPDFVNTTIEGNTALLSLDRPPVNALDDAVLKQLSGAIMAVAENNRIRVVVFTSDIRGIFSVGGDLKYWPKAYPKQPDIVSMAGRKTFDYISRLKKVTMAMVDGQVIGDGLSLVLACDIRMASHISTFQLPEIDYGFIPGWGAIGRLIRVAGKSKALELLLTGETIDAFRAESIGIINRVNGTGDIIDETRRLAEKIGEKPPIALQSAKAAVIGNPMTDSDFQKDWEYKCFSSVWGGKEWRQGIDRFLGK